MTTTEQKVQDQIARDRAQLDRDLAAVEDQRTRAYAEYDEHFAAMNDLSKRIIELDDAGEAVPDDMQTALNTAHAEAMRAMSKALGFGTRARRLRERLEHVGSDADVTERTNTAKRLAELPARRKGPGPKGPSMKSAAITVLLAHGPQHFREITRLAIESGLFRTKGKTPAQTMSAMLATDAKGDSPTFRRVAPGVFELVNADEAREALAGAAS